MALANFFDRIYGAVGKHLSISRDALAQVLRETVLNVECADELVSNEKMIAEMVVNLLSRLYPRLGISGRSQDVESLKEIARSINPAIEFCTETSVGISIRIGNIGTGEALYPSASGWVASLDHSGARQCGPDNPYSSAVAAALACAEVFRLVFLDASPERDARISLLDFGTDTGSDLELADGLLGDVLFVGVGAVGSAAIWCLSRDSSASGVLHTIDPETLTLPNLQRYVLATQADVGIAKVDMAARIMLPSRLQLVPYKIALANYQHRGPQPATTCVSLDNVVGRRLSQGLLPKLLINGWTGDRALGTSWHVFSEDKACLCCLYQPDGLGKSAIQQAAAAFGLTDERALSLWVTKQPLADGERKRAARRLGVKPSALSAWKRKPLSDLYTDVICGAVPIELPGLQHIEVVPLAHQSVLAGALMAAELVKRSDPSLALRAQSQPLIVWEDILLPPPRSWGKPRPREIGCICGDPIYQTVYTEKWGSAIKELRSCVQKVEPNNVLQRFIEAA